MPNPTSSNRIAFKNYLRANKQKFTSGIQTCVLGEIQNVILNISSGIDTSQVTRVIIFDDGERVGLSTVLNQKQLFYVPALPNDSIIIGVGTAGDVGIKSYRGYKLDFVGDGQGIRYENQIFGLNSVIGLGTDTSLTVLGLGGGLLLPGDPPTYSITESATTVNEGQTVSFAVTTTNVGSGTTLYYNIIGNTSNADFLDGSLSGSFVVTNGSGSFSKTLATDSLYNEFTEGFKVNISTGSTTGAIVGTSNTIFVTNLGEPSYTISASTSTVNEGGSVNFTVNTVNVGDGTTLYYSTGGSMEAADFSNNSLTGSFSIVGTGATTGIATVTRTLANDILTEGNETFTFVVRTDSISGPVVATSPTITVADVVPTYSVTPSATSVNEGSSVTFTVTTAGVPNGTVLYWTALQVSGTLSASDFTDVAVSGSFTVNNNTGTIIRTIVADRSTESIDIFQLEIRRSSITGTIVATSDSVTINDTSKDVGSNANGLTFGPVQVNRDNGNATLASDWYTICGLENLPDESSIALFIDNSGSMTEATVQASYNLLVSKLNAKGITITTVTNSNEDWITPFLVDLP
jgi:ligand-binding SRPBCC domain-containing protein